MRKYIQTVSTIFFSLPFLDRIFKNIPAPVLHCYACPLAGWACPVGIIQHFSIIEIFPFLTVGIIIIFGILFARGFCIFLCPFGFFQDILYKLKFRKLNIKINAIYYQYLTLFLLVILLPLLTKTPIFCYLCPAGTLEASIPIVLKEFYDLLHNPLFNSFIIDSIGIILYIKMLILTIFIIISTMISRPFCRICPLGLMLSFFNNFSLINRVKSNIKCKNCNNCLDKCVFKID